MTKRNVKGTICRWTAAVALAAAAALGGGCKSGDNKQEEQVDASANLTDQNRMLVRWTLAENVYNGIAAERAVYSADFDPGTAVLNRLGTQRVATLADASRNSTAPIVVVRGGAADELYALRVDAVRKELIAAGLQADEVSLAQNTHVGGGIVSSDRALLAYERLLTDYLPKQQGGAAGGTTTDSGAGSGSNGSNGFSSK